MAASSRAAKTTRQQKLAWLLDRTDRWTHLPMAAAPADRWTDDQRKVLKDLARDARLEGLYSPKTYLADIGTSLLWTIQDFRDGKLKREDLP